MNTFEGTEVLKTSFGNEKVLHGKFACERELVTVRLNNETSQELEEWSQSHSHSQAEALGFVDHFVSINKVDMSQGTDYRKTHKEKSPAVSSAEGPRNLARRFHQQTDVKENWKFEFIDNNPLEGLDSFRKKRSCTSHPTDVDADNRGYMSLGNEGRDRAGILNFDKENKDLSNLDKGFEGRSSKYGSEITQVYEAANEVNSSKEMELAGKPLGASDMGSDTLEIYDIGFNTQIAAEAIEALAYGNPFGNSSTGGCQDMENNVDGSLRGVTENNARLKLPFIQADACYDIGAILGSAKRKKRSDRRSVKMRHFGRDISNFSKKQSGIEELDPELKKSGSVLRSRLSAETKLCGRNSTTTDETSGKSSAQPIKQSEEGVLEMNNHMISATPIQNIPPINEQSRRQGVKVSPFTSRTGQHDSGVRLNRSEDRACTLREKMSDKIDQGALVYKRKRSRLNAYLLRVSSVRGKGLELCYSSEGAKKSMLNTSSKSDMWNCPKGQRTSRRVGKHSNITVDLNVPFNSHNQERTTGKANLKEKGKSASRACPCVPWNSSRNDFLGSLPGKSFAKPDLGVFIKVLSGSECITSVAVGVEKDHTSTESSNNTLEPSGSDCTTMSSKTSKNVVPSNNTYSCHQKRPCNKNLPKTSLLKELINLGVPKQIPEFGWKELRRRRDMAHVRVLFSQHLDDDVIKQQRKVDFLRFMFNQEKFPINQNLMSHLSSQVAARLGTSIVSCSMDATHFIADKFARTKNMLEAIALGKPVVTHLWLESCAQANCFIDEKNYILRDAKKEKEFGFSMPVSLVRANQHPLLKVNMQAVLCLTKLEHFLHLVQISLEFRLEVF